jgi:phosphoribosylformylglycinamidine synthase
MLAIVQPEDLDEVLSICTRWDVRASVVGTVTGTGRLRVLNRFDGEVLADMPAKSLEDDAPRYDRPRHAPADLDERRAADPGRLAAPSGHDNAADLLDSLADTSWVFGQYDHQLFLNTVVAPGGDAAVLRLKHPLTGADTGRGLALTVDGNHRWCAVDPRAGATATVAEAVLNLACVGGRAVALVDCLNFGNPEHPEVMWQLSEAIDGMGDACRALGLPVVGGNVSLYNESRGRDIDPTPIVGVLGVVEVLDRRPPGVRLADGGSIVLLGAAASALAGSRWAWRRGEFGGVLAAVDLDALARLCAFVRGQVLSGGLDGAHDVADGGLALALAEMAVASSVGFRVGDVDGYGALFAESPTRVVVCVDGPAGALIDAAQAAGVDATLLGVAGGDRLVVDGLLDIALADAKSAWRDRIPAALGSATSSS